MNLDYKIIIWINANGIKLLTNFTHKKTFLYITFLICLKNFIFSELEIFRGEIELVI